MFGSGPKLDSVADYSMQHWAPNNSDADIPRYCCQTDFDMGTGCGRWDRLIEVGNKANNRYNHYMPYLLNAAQTSVSSRL